MARISTGIATSKAVPRSTPATGYGARNPKACATGPPASAPSGISPQPSILLLGRARAELLEALRSPATTTDLARALGVTPSAVSQHLGVLRESGLVARERSGRNVLYMTTALGASLSGTTTGPLGRTVHRADLTGRSDVRPTEFVDDDTRLTVR